MRALATPKLVLWSALVLAGVGANCERGPSATAKPEPVRVSDDDLAERMHAHFEGVYQIKLAVVEGDLDSVRELAQAFLDRHSSDAYPLAWRPHVVQMLARAEGLSAVQDRATAAGETAELSSRCGQCHQALDVAPKFPDAAEPSEDQGIGKTMQRHAYATDRMWEGIIAPSDAEWERGLTIFLAFPECPAGAREEAPEFQRASCDRLHVLSERAASADTLELRTDLYGDVLETCAGCHRAYETAYQSSASRG